jgi:hypothetical protein
VFRFGKKEKRCLLLKKNKRHSKIYVDGKFKRLIAENTPVHD